MVDPRSYMTYQPFLPEAAGWGRLTAPRRGAAAPGAAWAPRSSPARSPRSTTPSRRPPCQPLEGDAYPLEYDELVMAVGSVSRTLPIPGPGRVGDRLQDRRGGHPAAQPGAGVPRHRRVDAPTWRSASATSPSSSSAAATPASRRSPSWRTWRATRPATTPDRRRRPAVPCSSRRAGHDPARGRARDGRWTLEQLRSAGSTCGSTRGWSPASTGTSCSPTAPSSTPRPWSGPPASRRTRCWRAPTCRWTSGAGCSPTPTCRWSARPTPGGPVTAPRSPT